MKIAVCDDDSNVVNQIESLILEAGKELSCDGFYTGEELVSFLERTGERYHIYFLDIEMPRVNGIEAASAIRRADKDAVIVFVTDHKEYVYDVFEVLPFRFIQKPVDSEVFQKVLEDAQAHLNTATQIFFFQVGRERHQLSHRDILYVEGAGRKVRLHTDEQTWEIYGKISEVAEKLGNDMFCRCHGSYIVNMDALRSIQKVEVALKNGDTIPVSKGRRDDLRKAHLSYMERRGGR